jgi:CYTH domain-containing protein
VTLLRVTREGREENMERLCMPREIERKFLVASDGWRGEAAPGKRFRQAIVFSEAERTLRVRIVDDRRATVTIKVGIDGSTMSRHEFEYEVPVSDGEELLSLANGNTIAKTRYDVPRGGNVWEIDVYDAPLDGLVVAEVEMKSEEEAPELPDWLGRELTGDKRFSNQALAQGSLGENWRDAL